MIENKKNTNETVDVIDLDLSAIKKKKIRINGDNNKIIELNTSDIGILNRLDSGYKELQVCIEEVKELAKVETDTDEGMKELIERFDEADKKMKDIVDKIFDSSVSDVCCDGGSMYDPFNGSYRFEHIIDALTKLYENNINAEYKKMKARVEKKANTYKNKR